MSVKSTLNLRKVELQRRVEALPQEVKQWQARTKNDLESNLHFSQLQAIGLLTKKFQEQQKVLLTKLDPHGNLTDFQDTSLELIQNIIRSQSVWDFFRDKLELRFSPKFKDNLWVADTVAWDCYRPILDRAADANILDRSALREPPLTYLTAEFSPATWVRGSRPNDGRDYFLGTSRLPIPVIEMPWDHIENMWELLSLHHEVAHDLEADLRLRAPLAASLQTTLKDNSVPDARIEQWLKWQGEVFADLVALQLGGPAFADTLLHLLLLPANMVTTFDPDDPHPTHYLRILMNTAYIQELVPDNKELANHSKQIIDIWQQIYGVQSRFNNLVSDFSHVFKALMYTTLTNLKDKTVQELIPFTTADDQRIRKGAKYLETGMNRPSNLRPRHCISAARIAVSNATLAETLIDEMLDKINERTLALVRSNAPSGLRGGDSSTPHKQFIEGFADKL